MKLNTIVAVIVALIVAVFQFPTMGSTDKTSGLIRNDIPTPPAVFSFSMTKVTDVGYFDLDPSLSYRNTEKVVLIVPPNDPEAVSKVPASSLMADISSGVPIFTVTGEISPKSGLYTYSLESNFLKKNVTVFKGSCSLGIATGNFIREIVSSNNNGTTAWYEEVNKITPFSSSFTSVPSVVGVGEYSDNSNRVKINCPSMSLKLNLSSSAPVNSNAVLRVYVSGVRLSDGNRLVIGTAETSAWGTKPIVTVNFPTGVYHSIGFVLEERFIPPAVQ